MFFRFGGAIVLAVLVSMAGVAIEKHVLNLRREVSRQYFRTEVLLETHARLRLRSQELSAPGRLIRSLDHPDHELTRPESGEQLREDRLPLMHWQQPTIQSR